ncbi:MAG: hypothetical protein OEW15_11640 [Nitrospirota bacterium]|nr:hypothetical protein [Nitrospirota bacterium]
MAKIDVSELLLDPDFVDRMTVVTRTPVVNSKGENVITDVPLETVGSVQPASGRTIQKLPEAMRVANISSFWFKGKIIASEPGKYSSIIVFKGLRYQVQTVFDWSNWGAGWSEGTCIAEVPA